MAATVYIPPAALVASRCKSRQKLWHGLRLMPSFTCRELTMMTDVAANTAQRFLAHMVQYGYVQARSIKHNQPTIYRFVNNTGPFTPYFIQAREKRGARRTRVLYDPNLKRIVYPVPGSVGAKHASPSHAAPLHTGVDA